VEFGQGALEVLVAMSVQPTKPAADRVDMVTSLLRAALPPSLHRVGRFGLSGLVATLIYLLLINVLVMAAGMAPTVASVCAYLLSLGMSYLLQSRFTFQVSADSVEQMTRFVVTSLAGLVIAWCVVAITVNVLAWPYFIGAAIVCIVIPVANFFIFRGWVFATHKAEDASPSAGSHDEQK
jgi:putative flippase GtrA